MSLNHRQPSQPDINNEKGILPSFIQPEAPAKAEAAEGGGGGGEDKTHYAEFLTVLAFLSSIGLATSAGGTYTLAPSSDPLSLRTASLLGWSSACFLIALTFIIGGQLLYTDEAIIAILKKAGPDKKGKRTGKDSTVLRLFGLMAWTSLGFELAALFLLADALIILGGGDSGPVWLARMGMASVLLLTIWIAMVAGVAIGTRRHIKKILFGWMTHTPEEHLPH